jgi:hypothetical protein
MRTGFFTGVKRPGRGVDHPLHLPPRLKKEYCYVSVPPLGLRELLKVDFYRLQQILSAQVGVVGRLHVLDQMVPSLLFVGSREKLNQVVRVLFSFC